MPPTFCGERLPRPLLLLSSSSTPSSPSLFMSSFAVESPPSSTDVMVESWSSALVHLPSHSSPPVLGNLKTCLASPCSNPQCSPPPACCSPPSSSSASSPPSPL